MSRIARWRKGPDDPATVRGWLTASSTPSVPDLRDYGQVHPFLKPGLALLILSFISMSVEMWVGKHWFLNALIPVLFGISIMTLLRAFSDAPRREPCQEDAGGYEVSVAIRDAHGSDTGRDHGLLIFCDGWLLFEGQRTSFAVTQGEAVPRKDRTEMVIRFEDRRSAAFSCLFPDQRDEIFAEFDRWGQSPPPDGEAILPPKETHLEIYVDRRSFFMIFAIVGLFLAAFMLYFEMYLISVSSLIGAIGSYYAGRSYIPKIRVGLSSLLSNSDFPPLPPLDRDALGSRPPATTSTLPD